MLKKLTIAAVLVIAATMCVGYSQVNRDENVQTRWFVEVAHEGDTFNDIIGHYYDSSIKANDCWDEWQTKQKGYNEKLFANSRMLQPGDKILIVTKVRIQK